jgi:tRNA A-37 threonylcarbamoyl transferase component Bud32
MIDFDALSLVGPHSYKVPLFKESSLEILEVVRYLPKKRLVVKGEWGGQSVYAKIFFGDNFEKYAGRDRLGVESLNKYQIQTPDLLCATYSDCKRSFVLVFKALNDSLNAEECYLCQPQKRKELAVSIVNVLAEHHQASIIQTDLYLKNFVVAGGNVYTLDGDGIRQYKFLTRNRALKNLAILISKFDVLEVEEWLPNLLEVYSSSRNWSFVPDLVMFKRLIHEHRNLVTSHYADKKVFRQCTDVAVYNNPRYFEAIARNLGLKQLPINIEACDALIASGARLKSGNTCTVSLATVEGVLVVVKRYNIKSFWHGVSRAFRQTRAAKSWANAFRLNILGISTPKPIALIEKRWWGLRGKAYFLSEYLDAPDAHDYFAKIKNKKLQTIAIKKIVDLFYRMHLLKLSHGDMKSSNIKLLDGNPSLIDLDSMRQHRCEYFALKAHAQDLRRFMQNWQAQPALYNMFVEEFTAVYPDHKALRLAGLIH